MGGSRGCCSAMCCRSRLQGCCRTGVLEVTCMLQTKSDDCILGLHHCHLETVKLENVKAPTLDGEWLPVLLCTIYEWHCLQQQTRFY